MKILQLIQKQQLRGAEVFASQLASHINNFGHEAFIVCLYPGKATLPFNGKVYNLDGNASRRFWDIKAWRKLAEIIKKEQPDIIQANAGDTLRYAVFSRMIFRWNKPVLFRNASTISLYIKSPIARKWNAWIFRFAKAIISVSETSAKDFAELFPAYKDRIYTVSIGIENTAIKENAINGVPALLMQKESNGPVLVHVGGFSFEKNHTGLIDIFEKFQYSFPNATLHLVGDGPLKEAIEKIVHQKGLQHKITFYGFQQNAIQYMRQADVLLLPSIIEGMPGVILEAFLCKTPVVAYDVGGIKEILINNYTGRIVEKGNESSFVAQIKEALIKSDENRQLLENAFQLVNTKYLNCRVAEKFIDIYASSIE